VDSGLIATKEVAAILPAMAHQDANVEKRIVTEINAKKVEFQR
jgi:hypothetical protein